MPFSWGKEGQRHERILTFEKSRDKRYKACPDVVEEGGFEPPKLTQQIYSLPHLATLELLHMKLCGVELVIGLEPTTG